MNLKGITTFAFSFLFFLHTSTVSAAIIEAQSNGYWYQTSVWKNGVVPASGDTVYIDGFNVEMRFVDATIKRLHLSNNSGNPTKFIISLFSDLTITEDIYVQGEGKNADIELVFKDDGTMIVAGPVNLQRLMSNSDNNRLQLSMSNFSRLYANGGLTFDYYNSGASESDDEITLSGYSQLLVTGDANFYVRNGNQGSINMTSNSKFVVNGNLNAQHLGGNSLQINTNNSAFLDVKGTCTISNSGGTNGTDIAINGGTISVGDSLNLVSTLASASVNLDVTNSGSILNVGTHIRFETYNPASVAINLNTGSVFNLAGNVKRPYNYGAIEMAPDALWIFNGTTPQTIPATRLTSGSDSIKFTSISLQNTSSIPFTLEGAITLQNDLNLTNGILQTSNTAMLTIADQANITGGNSNAYVNGPITKIGRNNGNSFVFPLGDNGTFAPFEISSVSNSNSRYTVQYFSCPPPIGTLQSGLDRISELEFWEFESSTGSDQVDVILHWSDAAASGIMDMASLVVVYHVDATGWTNIGNGGTTGSVGSGASGTIVNDISCPPPIGKMTFSYGSINPSNPLPVALKHLYAQQVGDQVQLDWETESNFDYFIMEKSENAEDFVSLGQISAKKAPKNSYLLMDKNPADGHNYYRLKMVDPMGMFRYSDITNVYFKKPVALTVFPNPVVDVFQITGLDYTPSNTLISVYNQSGQMIYQNTIDPDFGQQTISSESLHIEKTGIYFISIQQGDNNRSVRLVKK